MRTADFRLGQRVRRRSDEGAFVKDRRRRGVELKGRPVGIVIGLPEMISPSHRAATIQWEGSTRSDKVLIHRLEPLPPQQQPIALGGQWKPRSPSVLGL